MESLNGASEWRIGAQLLCSGKGNVVTKIYGLKNCDTCRKASKALPGAILIDIREMPVPDDVLAEAHRTFGSALLNTRSTTWRGLDDAARQSAPLELLRAHPALMKRPLIDDGGTLHLGWGDETRAALGAV